MFVHEWLQMQGLVKEVLISCPDRTVASIRSVDMPNNKDGLVEQVGLHLRV
jgi:hypothetical protein